LKNILKRGFRATRRKSCRSDAFPFNDAVGAEETFWLAARSAPDSVAAAARRIVARPLSHKKSLDLRAMYLHDHAAKLFMEKEHEHPGEIEARRMKPWSARIEPPHRPRNAGRDKSCGRACSVSKARHVR